MAKVLVIAGPTGCGKSSYALRHALDSGGVILNADSQQVYKGLEIITAQPSLADQEKVPHHLYGFLLPSETCSAGRWLSFLLPLIEECHKRGQLPIVVGGTGLYLKALLEGFSPLPPIDPKVREELTAPQEDLYRELQRVDPTIASRIQPQDTQRTIRALEVFRATGKPLSEWQKAPPTSLPYDFEKILIMPDKEILLERQKARLEQMFEEGAVEEVRHFLTLSPSPNALKAIGVREIRDFLEGRASLEETKDLILIHTRRYAKRQRTWFRHQFNPDKVLSS